MCELLKRVMYQRKKEKKEEENYNKADEVHGYTDRKVVTRRNKWPDTRVDEKTTGERGENIDKWRAKWKNGKKE